MQDVLQRIEQKIDAMGGRLEVVEGDISSVKVTLTEVKTGLSAVKTDLSGVKTDLSGVKTDLSRVKTDLSRVKTGLSRVKTDLSGLADTVHKQGALQEEMRDDIKQTLEGVIFLREATGRRFDEVITKLDERVQPIELATRYLATKKSRE